MNRRTKNGQNVPQFFYFAERWAPKNTGLDHGLAGLCLNPALSAPGLDLSGGWGIRPTGQTADPLQNVRITDWGIVNEPLQGCQSKVLVKPSRCL